MEFNYTLPVPSDATITTCIYATTSWCQRSHLITFHSPINISRNAHYITTFSFMRTSEVI